MVAIKDGNVVRPTFQRALILVVQGATAIQYSFCVITAQAFTVLNGVKRKFLMSKRLHLQRTLFLCCDSVLLMALVLSVCFLVLMPQRIRGTPVRSHFRWNGHSGLEVETERNFILSVADEGFASQAKFGQKQTNLKKISWLLVRSSQLEPIRLRNYREKRWNLGLWVT